MQDLKNKYILFDGFTYNTRGYFASCEVFFRGPKGRGKIRAMRIYFTTKTLQFWLLFSGKSVKIHPALSVHPAVIGIWHVRMT